MDLHKRLTKLAYENPDLRGKLLPLLEKTADLRLGPKDKKVMSAFLDKKKGEGKKLSTDGKRLDGLWMGGRGIAQWKTGKVHFQDLGSRAAQTVQRALKKMGPANDFAKTASEKTAASEVPLNQIPPGHLRFVKQFGRPVEAWDGIHGLIVTLTPNSQVAGARFGKDALKKMTSNPIFRGRGDADRTHFSMGLTHR